MEPEKDRFSYLPWGEDRSRADEVGIEGVASAHESVGAHFTSLGISPVPVWDGKVKIPCNFPYLILPVKQEDSVPGQKCCRFMGKVNVSPDVPWPPQEGVSGDIVVYPDKQIVGVDVREHGVLTIFSHLCSCCCGDDIVRVDGVFSQVEVRDEFLLLCSWHGHDVPAHWFPVLSTVSTPVPKPAFSTVKPSIVSCTATRTVEESQRPALSVINPSVWVLWPVGLIWDQHLGAEPAAWQSSASRAVSFPNWTAFFSSQPLRVGTAARKLGRTNPNQVKKYNRPKKVLHVEKLIWSPNTVVKFHRNRTCYVPNLCWQTEKKNCVEDWVARSLF